MAKQRVRMLCIVQEHALDRERIVALQAGARRVYVEHFGAGHRLIPVWITIPPGQAYIAGKPSTASTVSLPVPDGTATPDRHAFMSAVCSMWMDVTGCSENEIILTAMDQQTAKEYSSVMLSRIAPQQRGTQLLKLAWRMLKNRLTMGYLSLSINLA